MLKPFINEIPDESVEKKEISLNDNDDFEFNQDNSIEFDDDIISYIIDKYTYEPGVRKLKEILLYVPRCILV